MLNATVSGYVGKSELRNTQDGKQVLNFSIAHSEKIQGTERTTWVRCSVFGNRAGALADYIVKGVFATATGNLRLSVYSPNDGAPSVNADMSVNDVSFCTPAGRGDSAPKPQKPQENKDPFASEDDDVPF
jgi:single-strand DNA-binding protein